MFTTRPELLGRHAMVASTHWLASAAGMGVLLRAELFAQSWPTSAAVYLPEGRPPGARALFRNSRLAQTYKRIAGLDGSGAAHTGLALRQEADPPTPRAAAPPRVPAVAAGEPTLGQRGVARGDTCQVDVVDRDGLMVSATPSGGWLQSSPVIPKLGFCLGTRTQMCWLEEGLASSLRPGRRPRTTLSPTLCMRDGRPALAIGTPGGDQQDQWQLHVLLAHLHGGLNLQEAIDLPAFHSAHMPSSFEPREAHPGEVVVESRHDPAVIDDLLARGHRVVVHGPWSLGRVSAVAREADGLLRGAANPRGMQGYAVGR